MHHPPIVADTITRFFIIIVTCTKNCCRKLVVLHLKEAVFIKARKAVATQDAWRNTLPL
jgi:hypothetical protein